MPRLSVASNFGSLASLPASTHGSFPDRANTETTLRVMPFASVPTGAKRNSFNPEREKAKASELGILNTYNGMRISYWISFTMNLDTTCLMRVSATLDGIFKCCDRCTYGQHTGGGVSLLMEKLSDKR